METGIGQYAPIFLPGDPSLTEKPGRPQATGPQRGGRDQIDPARVDESLFARGSPAAVRVEREGGAAAWVAGALAGPRVQRHGLPHCGSYGPV